MDDVSLARDSLFELVGSCAAVKPILVHLKREYGRQLTVEKCLERITVDSPGWLAERNQSSAGGRVESAFATIDTPAGGKKKWQMQGAAAETSEFQELVQRVAEVQAALAAVAGPGKARVKGKGDSKAGGKGKGKGHCIQHQFEKDGCKKDQCWHKHDQA